MYFLSCFTLKNVIDIIADIRSIQRIFNFHMSIFNKKIKWILLADETRFDVHFVFLVNCDKLILFPVDCGFTPSHLWMNSLIPIELLWFLTFMWLGISLVLAQYIDKICLYFGRIFSKLLLNKKWIIKLKDMSKFDLKMTRNNKLDY